MSDPKTTGTEAPDFQITATLVRDEYPDVAAVLTQAGHDTGYQEGIIAGEQQARERIAAILALPEAEGRDGLAKHVAFSTTTDLEGARAMLAASPKAEAPKVDPLATAMASVDNPDVGSDEDDSHDNAAASVIAAGRELGVIANQ